MKKAKKIIKWQFYFVYFHHKVHFGIFNAFISSGVLLITRTILHTKIIPQNYFILVDKIVAITCFILVLIDFYTLLSTIVSFKDGIENEYIQQRKKFINEEKERIQDMVKPNNPDVSMNESVLQLNQLEKIKEKNLSFSKKQKDKKVVENLPLMIPLFWLSDKQAKKLGYTKEYNYSRAIHTIDNNKPFIDFAISNISSNFPNLQNKLSIKLLGPFLRLRIALFAILLTSLN